MTNLFSVIDVIENSICLSEIFRNCPYQILKALEIVAYRPGQILCQQEECPNNIFIIISGKVEVYYQAENGKEHIKQYYQEGTFIGELEMYDQRPASSSVRALTHVKLFKVNRETLIQWFKMDSHLSEYLFRQVSKKYYNYSLTSSSNLLYSVKYRVCNYLISFCTEHNKTTNVAVEFDKDKFTKVFGISIRSLNRTLQNLRDQKAVEIGKNTILVRDVQILEKIRGGCGIRDDSVL